MAHRNSEFVLLKSRKPKKKKQYYYRNDDYEDDDDDDDDDDDNQPELYRRMPRQKQRVKKYVSDGEDDSDYRPAELTDVRMFVCVFFNELLFFSFNNFSYVQNRIKIRKTGDGNRVILDEDDNVLKVIRDNRSPSNSSTEQRPRRRRPRHRPREAQTLFYEKPNGHIVSRPAKKTNYFTKKTQVAYADDEPTKVIKKVIIDPRTGDRETIYEKDKPKKQKKFYLQQHPARVVYDSDEFEDEEPTQYVRIVKHRTVPTEISTRSEPTSRYVVIKQRSNSDPVYARTTKMPAIKTTRRVVYDTPIRKPLTTYIYPHGKYYTEY